MRPSQMGLPNGNGIDWYQRIRKKTRDNDQNHQVPKLQTAEYKQQTGHTKRNRDLHN